MKKMMIAVCAIALAGMVRAAAVGWSIAGLADYKGDAYSFFVIGQNGVDSVAQITALCGAGTDVSGYAFAQGAVGTTGTAVMAAATTGKSLDAGNKYEGFFVIFDAADASKAENYVAITSAQSATLIQNPSATAGTITFAAANQSKFVSEPGNWSKVQGSGVPEPTSGLLLVLGCAALALRRKQK